ncbi:CRAL-TRIO domain-containing protein [Radiomyces spectabilis]|uniref:CRAL-TRIO domain-containing protein n=1 Tax=Radiomyces spectabilis TaxID=64574 RepID=UPI00221E6066|nr:CRAL-TRIO domain-containing protein [Radiomyces spectabilis]KAI8391583.1 CRAL-TRIO domain-containing protein [Radiomyces spectabilis]
MNIFRSKSSSNASEKKPSSLTVDHGPVTKEPILSPPADYSPVPPATLDEAQQEKLQKLREYMESIMLPETHEYYPNEKGFLTDGTLKRYMRARKWDYEAAKNMLENSVKWRRDYRPDEIDPDYIRPESETGKMYFNGFDKCGRPIWIMRPRLQNSKDGDRQIKNIVFSLERGIRLMPDKVENLAIIVDFKDSSASHNPSVATCKKFLDILGNHYPERLGIAFVVKSPWFFFATFKLISPFMDPVTKDKIKFVATTNAWVHLEQCIDPNHLETDFGGNYHFTFDIDAYWDKFIDHTGRPYKVIDY